MGQVLPQVRGIEVVGASDVARVMADQVLHQGQVDAGGPQPGDEAGAEGVGRSAAVPPHTSSRTPARRRPPPSGRAPACARGCRCRSTIPRVVPSRRPRRPDGPRVRRGTLMGAQLSGWLLGVVGRKGPPSPRGRREGNGDARPARRAASARGPSAPAGPRGYPTATRRGSVSRASGNHGGLGAWTARRLWRAGPSPAVDMVHPPVRGGTLPASHRAS